MQIKDRPEFKRKSALLTFRPEETVSTAVRLMSERNYGAGIVVDADYKPVGIVTERDFMRRLLNKGLNPDATSVGEIMTTDLKLARADDDLLSWLQMMSNERFRHLPVIDDQGKLISMMSQGDFVAYTWPQLMGRVTETAKAAFDVNPSIFIAIGGVIVFLLAVLIMFAAIS